MSRARDLADLIDANGDVKASNLDNVDALPSQTGYSGRYLTTDGTSASWGVVATPTLASLGIDNHDDITVDSSGNVALTGTFSMGTNQWQLEVDTDNDLLFKYNGTTVAKMASTGEIVSADDITGFGTP